MNVHHLRAYTPPARYVATSTDVIDIIYDGQEWTVELEDGQAIEICATSNGDNWTGSFAPHIKGLIEHTAVLALRAKVDADLLASVEAEAA